MTADRRCLTFLVGERELAVPIHDVREIIAMLPITPLPGVPAHLAGVANRAGRILPVFDLRAWFGLGRRPHGAEACIVIVESIGPDEGLGVPRGLIVDAVHEVTTLGGAAGSGRAIELLALELICGIAPGEMASRPGSDDHSDS